MSGEQTCNHGSEVTSANPFITDRMHLIRPPVIKSEERPGLVLTLRESLGQIAKDIPLYVENYYFFGHHLWDHPNQYYLDAMKGRFYIEINTDNYPSDQAESIKMNKKSAFTCALALATVERSEAWKPINIQCTLCETQASDKSSTTWTFYCKLHVRQDFDRVIIGQILD